MAFTHFFMTFYLYGMYFSYHISQRHEENN